MTNQPTHDHEGQPIVEFVYLNTNAEVKFHARWSDTLAQVWEQSYVELKESRRQADELQCQDGNSLMDSLNLSLAELRDRKICQNRKFQIKSETGGA